MRQICQLCALSGHGRKVSQRLRTDSNRPVLAVRAPADSPLAPRPNNFQQAFKWWPLTAAAPGCDCCASPRKVTA